jgi:transposase
MGNTVGVHRRKFTPDYRREAAHLVIDTGRTIAEVAREISVGEALLGRWVATERVIVGPVGPAVSESERAELERLRSEVLQLRMDNEFLGKAAAFFASKTSGRMSSR